MYMDSRQLSSLSIVDISDGIQLVISIINHNQSQLSVKDSTHCSFSVNIFKVLYSQSKTKHRQQRTVITELRR